MFDSKKKKYFKHKSDGVQKMIWDQEFKKEKTLMIREEVRKEYDNVCSKLHVTLAQIKSYLKDPDKICEVHNPEKGKEKVHKDKGTCTCEYAIKPTSEQLANIENLYDTKELLLRDKEGYEAQMRKMDLDVKGSPKTNEFPEGLDGIDQQLDALRELLIIIKQYIKEL